MSKVQSAITRQIVRGSVRERSNTNPHPSIFQPTVSSSITASFITPSFLSRVLTDSLLPKAHWRPSLCECLTATVICSFILLSGCGSSKRSTPIHDVVDPNKAKQIIPILGREKVLDSVPIAGLSDFAPNQRNFYLAHLSKPESKVAYSGDCQNLSGKDLVKATKDLAEIEYTTIIEHHLQCDFEEKSSYTTNATITVADNEQFSTSLAFSTGNKEDESVTVLDNKTLPPAEINNLVEGNLTKAIEGMGKLPSLVKKALEALIYKVANDNWKNLTQANARYPVISEKVSYLSVKPDGTPDTNLTGLVTRPDLGNVTDFTPRDRVIVLTHATGGNPGSLALDDTWFIVANILSSHGYLVVAADNYGRVGTSKAQEPYLIANATAYNSYDLLKSVVGVPRYDKFRTNGDVTVVGYSQGGHTAVALWQLMSLHRSKAFNLREVYAGGGPYNLYETFRGVIQFIDNSCKGSYCKYVTQVGTVPFLTKQILPAILTYSDTGLSADDLYTDKTIKTSFARDFLANEITYDRLKALLQVNSFTNIINPEVLANKETSIHLYHSKYDRLVPHNNATDLVSALSPAISISYNERRCNNSHYEQMHDLLKTVGILHAVCGFSTLDDVIGKLR